MNTAEREKIIPAIDIIDGKCTRLTRGDYACRTVYPGDPLSVALRFQEAGLTRLHLVDLDGARAGRVINTAIINRIVTRLSTRVDVSGGIRTLDDARRVLDAGATWACTGSVAVEQPELVAEWIQQLGADRLIIMLDTLHGKLRTRGWLENTGITPENLIDTYRGRVQHLACTDIARDGTLAGPNIPLYQNLRARYPTLHLIASGGVRDIRDIRQLLATGVDGVITGKALHEGKITLDEISTR
jgi:phosphoribosylformimino-5-aminoimidazole carboxamide ribotide isomerase